MSTKKWMKEWIDVTTEHLPVLPVRVWDKPASPRGWSTDELPISIIHVNPVGHPFMWWSGIVPLNRPAATAIRKVTESRDKFYEPGCRLAWEREAEDVTSGSLQDLVASPWRRYSLRFYCWGFTLRCLRVHSGTRPVTGCEMKPHVAGPATAAEYRWTPALPEPRGGIGWA